MGPSGIFRHCKSDKILNSVFAYLKNLVFVNLERAPTWVVHGLFYMR